MTFYKRVVNEFPATPEAETALLGIRNIYLDSNDADGYIRYTNQIGGFAKIDDRERDSISYVSAERVYMAGNFEQAINQFNNYILNNPQGRFVLNANYYKAECLYRDSKDDEALPAFEYVAGRGKSRFSENAIKHAGEIHYRKENYNVAHDYFKRLETEADMEENRQEALIGQMRALSKMNNPALAVEAGNRVIENSKMSPEIVREARYLKANSLMSLDRVDQALAEYRILSKNTAGKEGAEAKYMVAEILFKQGKANDAEKEIFHFTETGTPHQYWLAKSFILLADIYAARGEYFQAGQYLESLLENYENQDDGIHEAARERLDKYN
jgi:TolA-binding protein